MEAFFPPEKSNLTSQGMPSPGESGASLGRSHIVQVSQEAFAGLRFQYVHLGHKLIGIVLLCSASPHCKLEVLLGHAHEGSCSF